jgi:rare lipoprotein A
LRRALTLLASIAALLASLATGSGARADTPSDQLAQAKRDQAAAQAGLASARARLDATLADYQRLQDRLQQAAIDVVGSYEDQDRLDATLAEAQRQLDEGAANAYEAGPGVALDVFLGVTSPADLASAQEFAARAIGLDQATIDAVAEARAALAAAEDRQRARQQTLAADVDRLTALAAQAGAALAAAQQAAADAGAKVASLQKEVDALAAAEAAVTASLGQVVDPGRGTDQSKLLALLGPSGGKTCDIPSGLTDTGERLAGQSSWYGWDFAGQRTATGAIFDPRLFTVANKELPLNVFVRLHFGGKCAIALVNDRGPYGVAGRIFDASEAVAEYLGYQSAGVANVTADVLIPSS